MPRKTKAQIEREIQDALNTAHCLMFSVPGSPWVWFNKTGGGSMNPDDAIDFKSRETAERAMDLRRDPSSSVKYKYVTRKKI